jgi:3-oxoacyl-[acyl-carrier protein] reductase
VIDLGLDGKTVIVTGAGSGIGAAIAAAFGAQGASVIVHYRSNRGGASAVASSIGNRAWAVKADITSARGPSTLVRQAVAHTGRVDVLVNNAVLQPITPLPAMPVDEWRAVMETNVNGTFRCTAAVTARMIEQGGGGCVIHITSIEGSHPAVGHAHYATSKAALLMHARSAALELGSFGIRVNTVSPGLVRREGLERAWPSGVARWRAAAPLGDLVEPGDVAAACLFLASPMASAVTGHDLVVDAGVTAGPTW